VLRKARPRGITVLTWDADAEPDARDYFVNQRTAEGIGYTRSAEARRSRPRWGRNREQRQPPTIDVNGRCL
jgi:hypothetical protein